MEKKGRLLLIPTPLGQGSMHTIPPYVLEQLSGIQVFIAERAKTARHFIKAALPEKDLPSLEIFELNKRTLPEELTEFLLPAEKGEDIGLMSEAGCPGVADPGAEIVRLAHQKGIQVVPLVGPSSILLALMASGMNGQGFAFQGYLPAKKLELAKALKKLEQVSGKLKQTQIFIETPYRNHGLIEVALASLKSSTRLCIAAELTLSTEFILTKTIGQWKKATIPDLHKKPVIFLLQAL